MCGNPWPSTKARALFSRKTSTRSMWKRAWASTKGGPKSSTTRTGGSISPTSGLCMWMGGRRWRCRFETRRAPNMWSGFFERRPKSRCTWRGAGRARRPSSGAGRAGSACFATRCLRKRARSVWRAASARRPTNSQHKQTQQQQQQTKVLIQTQ